MFLQSIRLCLIACRYLVEGYREDKEITTSQIVECFGMNIKMIDPALNNLVSRGILRSQIGDKETGYILYKDPIEIYLYDMLYALEVRIKMRCSKDVLGENVCEFKKKEIYSIYNTVNNSISQLKEKVIHISSQQHYDDSKLNC